LISERITKKYLGRKKNLLAEIYFHQKGQNELCVIPSKARNLERFFVTSFLRMTKEIFSDVYYKLE